MKKVVIFFLLISGFSEVFSQQSLDQDLTTLMSKKRSPVNALAKIIVDEDGKITVEQIKNDLNTESTNQTTFNNKEINNVDPESVDEESKSGARVNPDFSFAPEYVAPQVSQTPLRLDSHQKNIAPDNILPQEIRKLDSNSYYNIYQSPSQAYKLNQKYSFIQNNKSSQIDNYSENLPFMDIETTSEKNYISDDKNEIKISSKINNQLPDKISHEIEKKPLSSTPGVNSVKMKPGDYEFSSSVVNRKIQNQKIHTSLLSEDIIENEEQEVIIPERDLQAFDVSKPSEAFKEQLLPKLSKLSSLAELTLDSTSGANYSYASGNMLTGWVNVTNYGSVDAGKFSTAFIVSANQWGSVRYDFPLPLDSVAALAADSSHKFEFSMDLDSLKNLPTGSFYVTFSIDNKNEVNESNENNNLWYFTKPISYTGKGQPNLFTYQKSGSMNQIDYDTLTQTINNIYLSVGNDGKEKSNPTDIWYVLSAHDLTKTAIDWTRDSYLGYAFVPSVSRGTFLTTALESPISLGSLTKIPTGEWYINAVLDGSLNVNEEDDTDNHYIFKNKLPYTNYNGLPDLTLFSSDSTNNAKSYNSSTQELSLKVHVVNDGDAASGSYKVGWYLSENTYITRHDNLIAHNSGSWLNSGAYRAHTDTFDLDLYAAHIPSADTFYVGFIIDSWNEVEEAKENNNTYRWSNIIKYDSGEFPALGAFNYFGGYSGFKYDEDKSMIKDVYLSIENSGKGAAGSFFVDWYLSYNKTMTNEDFYIGSAFLNRLSSGAHADAGFIDSISLDVEGLPDGTYYLGARIDANNSVNEIDKIEYAYFYNTIDYQNPGGFLPELAMVYDSSSYATTDSTVGIDIKIVNNGEAPARDHYIFNVITPDSGYIDYRNSYVMNMWHNMVLDTSEVWSGNYDFNYLNQSAMYADTTVGWVNTSIPSGEYYIAIDIDPYDNVVEYNEDNNNPTGAKVITVGDTLTAGLLFYDINMNFSYQSSILGGDTSVVHGGSTTPIVDSLIFAIANHNPGPKAAVYLDVFLQSMEDIENNKYPETLYASRYPQYIGQEAYRLGTYGYADLPGGKYFVDTVSTLSLSDSALWKIIPEGSYQLGMRVYSPESKAKASGKSEDFHYFRNNESYNRSGTPNVVITIDTVSATYSGGYIEYKYQLTNIGDAPVGYYDLTSYVNNTQGRYLNHDYPYVKYINDGLASGYYEYHKSEFHYWDLDTYPETAGNDLNLTNVLPAAYYYFSTHVDQGSNAASKWGSPELTDYHYVDGKAIPNLVPYPYTPNQISLIDTAKVDTTAASPKLKYSYVLANNGSAPVFLGLNFIMLFSEDQRGEISINDVYDKIDDGDYLDWDYVKRIRSRYRRNISGTIDLSNTFFTPGEYMMAWAAIDYYNEELTYADNADLFDETITYGSTSTFVEEVSGKIDLQILNDKTNLTVLDNKINDTMTIYNYGSKNANNANVALYMDYSYAVSAYPIYPSSKDSIRIFYHADRGTGELKDYADTVYASTGVLVGTDKTIKYPKNLVPTTRVSTNTYQLTIGEPHKYFEVSTDSQIVALTFQFKNADGSKVSGEKSGEAIHYYLNEDSLDLNLNNGLVGIGDLDVLYKASGGGTQTQVNESPPSIDSDDYTLLTDGSLESHIDWTFPVVAGYGDFTTFTIKSDWHSKRPNNLELLSGSEVVASWVHPKKEIGGCAKDLDDYLANGLSIDAADCTTETPSFSTGVLNKTYNSSKVDSLTLRVKSAWEPYGIIISQAWVGGSGPSKTSLQVSVDLDSLDRLLPGIYYPKAYAYNGSKINGFEIDTTLYDNFLSGEGEIDIVDVGTGGKQNSPPNIVVTNFTIKDNRTTSIPVVLRDLDGDSIKVSIDVEKDSLSVAFNATMDTLNFTPVKDYLGTMRVTFTLSDSTYSNIKKNIYVTVTHENRPPVFTSNYLSKVSFLEDGKYVGVLKAVDPEYDKLTYTAKSDNDTLTVSVNKDTLTITSSANWFGTGKINAYTTDDESASDTLAISVTVASVNDAPVVSADETDFKFDEDTDYKYSVSYSDVENDNINVSSTTSKFLDIKLTPKGSGGLEVDLTPKPNWNGATQFTLSFTDDTTANSVDDGDTTTVTFTATVNPVNDKPTLIAWTSPSEVDSIAITANDEQSMLLNWNESRDVDGDSITYLVTMPNQQVLTLTSDSISVSYVDFATKYWPEQFSFLPRLTGTIKLAVSDGNDTIPATNADRVVFINRYDYLGIYQAGVPTDFALHENYPNPFNPSTTLRFDLPELSDVTVTIFNMLGQKVKTFSMQSIPAGYHSVTWGATNDLGQQVGAGVYLYQLQTKDFVKTRKMVLLK